MRTTLREPKRGAAASRFSDDLNNASLSPIVTCDDRRRLGSLMNDVQWSGDPLAVAELDEALDGAIYVGPDEIPPSIVTMNSTVELLDLRTQRRFRVTLAYPAEAELFDDSVSVLDPLGLELLGAAAGSIVEYRDDLGVVRYRIASVVDQPESH